MSPDEVSRLRRKVAWRILPLLLVLYIIAYLDRVNVSHAALQMQPALKFTDAEFGWGVGLFFVGYLLLEIPGALLVEHWSARKWFARILVTWGACSMAMAFVTTPRQSSFARNLRLRIPNCRGLRRKWRGSTAWRKRWSFPHATALNSMLLRRRRARGLRPCSDILPIAPA